MLDSRGIVPLDEDSLLAQAMRNTGLDDFGDDQWREPFRILLRSIEEEADLNLVGRIFTRSDMLIHLEGRLRITDWYKRHPEIEDEVIREPVFITGLPRSGTTIMQEVLGADPTSRVVRMWEAKYPVPPPAPGDPVPDPRIAKADAVTTFQDRDHAGVGRACTRWAASCPSSASSSRTPRSCRTRSRRRSRCRRTRAGWRRRRSVVSVLVAQARAQAAAVDGPPRALAAQGADAPAVPAGAVRRVPRREGHPDAARSR